MLTRLTVSGFKNLVDVDVYFGPFTCIAGANGVGKSNLFDAIRFLSALADQDLIAAARSVRDEERSADIQGLFHRFGDQHASEMSFTAEMIVPYEGLDELGQVATASITFLTYTLTLAYRQEESRLGRGPLEILKEELSHINIGDAGKHLPFPHSKEWRKSAVRGSRRTPWLISTDLENEARVVKLHQDQGGGRPYPRPAASLRRTVLSVVNAADSPTAALARREIMSWRLLLLEPSALRRADKFDAPAQIGADGSNLPSTLYHLAHSHGIAGDVVDREETAETVYAQVANQLSELIDDVRTVAVERDEGSELYTLVVKGRDSTPHPARSLSDGTLRFLALSVLYVDPTAQGVLCLEEPENGIHPERIPAMLQLLRNIAVDVDEEVGPDNPLRQVIINTHSPAVVAQVEEDDLLVAELKETIKNGRRFLRASFDCLPETWRGKQKDMRIVSRGTLLAYLDPVPRQDSNGHANSVSRSGKSQRRRVIDREDLQPLLPGMAVEL